MGFLISNVAIAMVVFTMASSAWAALVPEWSEDMRMTYSPGQEGYQTLVIDHNDNVYLSWATNYRGTGWFGRRLFTKLDRNGSMLIQPTVLPAYSSWSQGPVFLAVDSQNNIHAALHCNEDIFHRRIDAFGNLSGVSKMNKTTGYNTDFPKLLIDKNDRMHLLFQDEQNDPIYGDNNARRDVFYQRLAWVDNALKYEVGPVEVTIVDGAGYPYVGYVGEMSGAVLDTEGNVHAVWSDWRQSSHEVYYSKLSADGTILIPETQLTNYDGNDSLSPEIFYDTDNNLHIIWRDARDGSSELFYKKLDSAGNTLIDDKKIATGTGLIGNFSAAIDVYGNIHILCEKTDGLTCPVIYAMINIDGEMIVEAQIVANLTSSSMFGWHAPTIAVDSEGRVHLTWVDNRNGDWEVYYRYGDVVDGDAVDMEAPVITLVGNEIITVEAGTSYIDAGAKAFDNVDGDLIGAIEVDNPVNTSVIGTYTVTYKVTDTAGNAATEITRTVHVVDTIPPTTSIFTDRDVLWPPNHKMVNVLVDGGATDSGSGIESVVVSVLDEYGQFNLTGYSLGQRIPLKAWRKGKDKNGRIYTVIITATDKAGNVATATKEILVPHHMGK